MPVYKLIKNGAVVNTIVAELEFFSTSSDEWDSYEEVVSLPPTSPVVTQPAEIRVSPVEFKLLFTSAERVAIKSARATNPVIDDFFDIIDDTRLTEVNLNLQSTINAVNYLEAESLIGEGRAAEILSGQFQ